VNRLAWMQDRYGMEPGEALLQKTPFSFDVSFWEFFWPLMVGARVVMASPGGHRDPAYLVDVIRREGITHAHFVPSMLPLFLEHPDAAKCTTLLRVPVSGEAVSAALVRQFHERLPAVELTNQYGPTESGEVTEWACDPRAERVSIGRPIHNAAVCVLDRAGEPVPVGVAGELFIGGVAVARGYLGRPRLTAERFVPDPFGEPGARLYRTGDRCRWLRDGTLEYLGRTDFQVKVRGLRVEPGEIEARLAAHPGVREAAVLALDDADGGKRLVAYFAGEALEGKVLRAHLSGQLPEYMVPAAFVRLERLPLNPNGKLDRRALPAPDADAFGTRAYAAPVGETEEALAGIWAGVLGVERVGRHDNFFELGGHSLLAVRVVSRMRQVLGAEVVLAHVFSHPTVESLAARLAGADDPQRGDRAIAVRAAGSRPPLFLAYDGMGSVAYAQVLHPHVDAGIPVYALPAPSPSEPPLRTVEAMAARLVRMIREVQPSGPYWLAGWSFGGVLAYEVAAQLVGRGETVEFVGLFDCYYPVGSTAAAPPAAQSPEARWEHALILHALRTAGTTADGEGAEIDEEIAAARDEDLETFVLECREEGLLPRHVTVAQARAVRDRLRNHQRALGEYAPQPLPVLLHQFPAADDRFADPTRGWGAVHPEGRLRVTPVPGTHLSMMRAPNTTTFGEALSRALDRARTTA
jgi:thioesterase domain-containing protein